MDPLYLSVLTELKRKEGEIAALYAVMAGVLYFGIREPEQRADIMDWMRDLVDDPSKAIAFSEGSSEADQLILKDAYVNIVKNLKTMLDAYEQTESPPRARPSA